MNMPVLFKRNSMSSNGGGGGDPGGSTDRSGQPSYLQYGSKRPQEPTEVEKVLAYKSQTQAIKLEEKRRQEEFQRIVNAVCVVQRSWRRYVRRKGIRERRILLENWSTDTVRRKRLRATQEEWERQIAALTIQLAWRKFYRRKLMRTLHPNKRQLLMWDPEIIQLKQQALIDYIYTEQIQAPFWHPVLRAPVRPLWMRFVPSPAAVSYNFAADQYVPWMARIGARPPLPELEEESMSPEGRNNSHESGRCGTSTSSSRSGSKQGSRGSRGSNKGINRQKSTVSASSRISQTNSGKMRRK